MAKTTYLDIPAGFDYSFNKVLSSSDRFLFPSVRVKPLFQTRRRIKGMTQKSLMPECATNWNAFTLEQKALWTACGQVMGLAGFKFYLADKVLRMQNSLAGDSTPSLLYQTYVGRLSVASPASHLLISQMHPYAYWVSAPVHGKKNMRQPVKVTEHFTLPLEISLSYSADLVAVGGSPRARFYAIVYSLYQGRTIENIVEIPFTLSTDWISATATLSRVVGMPKSYALFLELYNVRGDLFFDNIKSVHGGLNWCRDSICRDIDASFTKAFFQVPKNWTSDVFSQGCFFGSVYFNAL